MGLGFGTREALSKAEIENLPTIRGGGLGWGVKIGKMGVAGGRMHSDPSFYYDQKAEITLKLLRFLVDNLGNIWGDFIDFLAQF